jgi:hypothetical protein
MFLVEAALALSVVCTLPRRRNYADGEHAEPVLYVITTDNSPKSFQVADGASLEQTLTNKIREIQGVDDVVVKQAGTSYEVSVTMGTFAFESYEKVINEELALLDKHPDLVFEFQVSFSDHAGNSDSLINAA